MVDVAFDLSHFRSCSKECFTWEHHPESILQLRFTTTVEIRPLQRYTWSQGFREFEIKMNGGDTNLNYDHFPLNLFLIDRTPTGFVYMSTVDRHIELHSQPSDFTHYTGGSTLTRTYSHMRSWKSEKINLDLMFWFDVDEQIKNDHFCIFLVHNWNLEESLHENWFAIECVSGSRLGSVK